MIGNLHVPRDPASSLVVRVRSLVQGVAFWIGVLLPLTYVPLLLFVESGRIEGIGLLTRVVAANAVACIVGYGYDPGR